MAYFRSNPSPETFDSSDDDFATKEDNQKGKNINLVIDKRDYLPDQFC